ncbi:MAG TPA: indolepyruvate oxidoreductase subunit beta [Longimicrobiales bacterium]
MNIVFAGVGGQGSVLATAVVAAAVRRAGHNVVTSEVHGMSQRGGTVTTAVRYGRAVFAPVVATGEADVLVAFERLEAARHFPLLKMGGLAVVNDHRISPTIESLKIAEYPDDLRTIAEEFSIGLAVFPATELAVQLGDARLSAIVLLGCLANFLDLPLEAWRGGIAETVPAHTVAGNIAAFTAGEEWGVGPPSLAF